MQVVGEYAQRKRPVVPQRGPSPSDFSQVGAGGTQGLGLTLIMIGQALLLLGLHV
jgi:hypothetical protein